MDAAVAVEIGPRVVADAVDAPPLAAVAPTNVWALAANGCVAKIIMLTINRTKSTRFMLRFESCMCSLLLNLDLDRYCWRNEKPVFDQIILPPLSWPLSPIYQQCCLLYVCLQDREESSDYAVKQGYGMRVEMMICDLWRRGLRDVASR